MQPATILVIDDDARDAAAVQNALASEGYRVEIAMSYEAGQERALRGTFDVVVTDMDLTNSDQHEGLEIIRRLHAEKPQLPVILITGNPTTESTIEAMKLGAFEHIHKPVHPDTFLPVIARAVTESQFLTRQTEAPRAITAGQMIVGHSPAMHAIYKQIGRLADTSATVLIRGETGTGKELVAHALHQHGSRAGKPFVIVNCPAIPSTLLASELFGHEPGAFTDAKTRRIGSFEQADGGTIFLDEIGDMPRETQSQLLRVLQDRTIRRLGSKESDCLPINVRVIAATHRDLELALVDKEFREDLYHRLNVAVIHLPPLRERREDIPELVEHFLEKFAGESALSKPQIHPEALELLQQQTWPGNVRELSNVVHKAFIAASGYSIDGDLVRQALRSAAPPRPTADESFAAYVAGLLAKAMQGELANVQAAVTETVERELYAQALKLAQGDQTKAAGWLGVSRPTMREKLIRYGLHPTRSAA